MLFRYVWSGKKNFLVEYFSEQKRISTSLPDSVKKKKVPVTVFTINNGDTTNTDTVEANMSYLIGSASFAITFYILSNKDISKRYFTLGNKSNSESNGNFSFTLNIPVDTIFYDRKKWYEISEGSTKEVESADTYYAKIYFIKTPETKSILGYKCVKFVSSGKDKYKNISFWACKDLPATLIPFEGLEVFGYGILQVENPEKGVYTKATKITKL